MSNILNQQPESHLISKTTKGGITLVLGAGISIPRGIPNWETLAKNVWHEVFGGVKDPWFFPADNSSRQVPQFLPITFELVYRETGEAAFIKLLRKHLYQGAKYPAQARNLKNSNESLAVLARLIVQEYHRQGKRRIEAVITFNADDFIEQAVQRIEGITRFSLSDPLRVFARSTHSFLGGPNRRSIPIYHLHGFLPSNRTVKYPENDFDHMLVFTDTQYWATSASGASFANRVMASALGEGCCIFIGLSMTDINLLRWFALRNFERDKDVLSITRHKPEKELQTIGRFKRLYEGHFWIRPVSDDPSGFLSKFLLLRGINSVDLNSWHGDSFRKLMESCFP
jgi:hypothetical protein